MSRTKIYVGEALKIYSAYTDPSTFPIVSLVKLSIDIEKRSVYQFRSETRKYKATDSIEYEELNYEFLHCDWYKNGMSEDEIFAKLEEYLTLEYEEFGKGKHE